MKKGNYAHPVNIFFHAFSTCLHFLDSLNQLVYGFVELGAFLPLLGNLVVGVHDRRMVAAAETLSYLRQGSVRQFSAEEHGHLTGLRQ